MTLVSKQYLHGLSSENLVFSGDTHPALQVGKERKTQIAKSLGLHQKIAKTIMTLVSKQYLHGLSSENSVFSWETRPCSASMKREKNQDSSITCIPPKDCQNWYDTGKLQILI